MESDAEKDDNQGTNCPTKKKSKKKQGIRDIGQKKETNSMETNDSLTR